MKRTSETKSIHLTVPIGYQVPKFYTTATPSDIAHALREAVALVTGNAEFLKSQVESQVSTQVTAAKEEFMKERETQLAQHEAILHKIMETHNKQIEEVKAKAVAEQKEMQVKITQLIAENDELVMKAEESTEKNSANFETSYAKYSAHLSQLYKRHHSLIQELDKSMTEIRAKEYLIFKDAQKSAMEQGVELTLPHESACDFVEKKMKEGVAWNNIKHSARDTIEKEFHKESFMLILKQDKEPKESLTPWK